MWGVCVCVSDSGQLEQKLEEATSACREMEGSSKHLRSLEKQMKSLNLERDDLHKVGGVCVSVCFFPRPRYCIGLTHPIHPQHTAPAWVLLPVIRCQPLTLTLIPFRT